MIGNLVTIVREGQLINIDEDCLRKDDAVVLQTADVVPADLRLIEAEGLEVDEFDITGELLPVIKKVGDEDVILHAGSKVTRGSGQGIVIAAGEETEYGRILHQSWEQGRMPEVRIFEKRYLSLILLLLPAFLIQAAQSNDVIGVIVIYLLWFVLLALLQNSELFRHLLVSYELDKLKRFSIQIRDPDVMERMIRMDIVCFDKTGVLTTCQMEVKNIYLADAMLQADLAATGDEGAFHWIKIASALSNDVLFFEKLDLASPIDRALIAFAMKNGVDDKELLLRHKRIYDKPFDSENRHMVVGFELDGRKYYFAKGDPGVVLRMCMHYMSVTGDVREMDYEFWGSHLSNIQAINESGDTAIALAFAGSVSDEIPEKYTFLCLVQLQNPLQPDVCETIAGMKGAGIRNTLLTGDRAETAASVAMACGLTNNGAAVLTGNSIQKMEPREVARQSAYCSVFARLIPSQKALIVRLFQEKGHCVGMVGDGVNDGIALRVADIGLSFIKDSSPIARRFSDILVNDLADLLILIHSAHRIKKRSALLRSIRILSIAGLLFGLYAWVFAPHILGG